MVKATQDILENLAARDEDFRNWTMEHRQHEARLSELATKSEFSQEEELEEKRLKIRKLFLKDQMAERIRSFEMSQSA